MKFITLGFVTLVLTFITLGNMILYVQQITTNPYGPETISGERSQLIVMFAIPVIGCVPQTSWPLLCGLWTPRAKKMSGVFQVVLLMERFLLEVASLSHYLQGFVHPRWLFGISSINSINYICSTKVLMLWAEQQLGFWQGACRSTFIFKWHHLTQKFLVIQKFPMEKLEAEHHSLDQKEKHYLSKPSSLYFPDVFFGGLLNCWTCWLILSFQQLKL